MLQAARLAAAEAYAPYSHFRVGAVVLTEQGTIHAGCNVENASYGVGLCAECALVGDLHMSGGGQLVAFVCVNGAGETIMPCGRCRQLARRVESPLENGAPAAVIESGVLRLLMSAGAQFRRQTPPGMSLVDYHNQQTPTVLGKPTSPLSRKP